jgi:hypothetical protein
VRDVVVQVEGKANDVERSINALEVEFALLASLVKVHELLRRDFEPLTADEEVDGLKNLGAIACGSHGLVGSREVVLLEALNREELVDEVLEVKGRDVDLAGGGIEDSVELKVLIEDGLL